MRFIDEHRAVFRVEPICRVLTEHGVTIAPSTYYDARDRVPSKQAVRDGEIVVLIRAAREDRFVRRYGARKMWSHLRREGHDVARCTIERLMRAHGWSGALRGKKHRTTIVDPSHYRPMDLVQRDFTTTAPNQLWVADFTYVATWSGTVYVAFIFDAYSRMICGWRAADRMDTSLVLDTLEHAIWTRQRGGVDDMRGLVHHTDAGSQGGFNWSSQHLVMEVFSGTSSAGRRSGDPSQAPVTWSSEVSAACRGGVLGADRQRTASDRGHRGYRRGAGGWSAMVPARWRHAAV